MAKATVSPTWNLDDIAEAGLAQPHGHAWQVLIMPPGNYGGIAWQPRVQ